MRQMVNGSVKFQFVKVILVIDQEINNSCLPVRYNGHAELNTRIQSSKISLFFEVFAKVDWVLENERRVVNLSYLS